MEKMLIQNVIATAFSNIVFNVNLGNETICSIIPNTEGIDNDGSFNYTEIGETKAIEQLIANKFSSKMGNTILEIFHKKHLKFEEFIQQSLQHFTMDNNFSMIENTNMFFKSLENFHINDKTTHKKLKISITKCAESDIVIDMHICEE